MLQIDLGFLLTESFEALVHASWARCLFNFILGIKIIFSRRLGLFDSFLGRRNYVFSRFGDFGWRLSDRRVFFRTVAAEALLETLAALWVSFGRLARNEVARLVFEVLCRDLSFT